MSEQLSLGGILPPSENEKDAKTPTKKRATTKSASKSEKAAAIVDEAMKSPLSSTIEARINALMNAKAKTDAALVEKKKSDPLKIEESAKIEISSKTADVAIVIASKPAQLDVRPDTAAVVEIVEEALNAEPEVLTVSALNRSIKGLLEKTFPFLWVKGEISNFKVPASGHMYFTLKDSTSQVRAVMFRGFAQALKFKPEDGMEVLVRCKVTAYEPRGDYQLFCEVMEPVGFGALQVAFEKLKAKLQSEGLFAPEKKRALPALPRRIGIITSPTGAAIRDMLNILSRRMGAGLDITIIPTPVQGDKAPAEIVRAIETANRLGSERFDVLIVGRGGGSLEDLWAFNEEIVARAVANSKIPTISAVGHEVDFTICDFVADLRAPTPSAAAELVVKNKQDLLERISFLQRHLVQHVNRVMQISKAKSEGLSKRLVDPKRRLQDLMLRCDEWTDRLIQAVGRYLQDNGTNVKFLREKLGTPEERIKLADQKVENLVQRMGSAVNKAMQTKRGKFGEMISLLNGLSPLAVLDRGYSIVKKGGQIVKDSTQVKRGDEVTITLHKGQVSSRIL
jgi:exodeoxyribonuclease VII large subunit